LASVAIDVTVIGALVPKSEITIGPQLVVKVNVLAGLFAATVGCLTFAGACPFAVLFAHPGTVTGRSADCAGAEIKDVDTTSANASVTTFAFLNIIEFLFPFDCARRLACNVEDHAIYFADLVGNAC